MFRTNIYICYSDLIFLKTNIKIEQGIYQELVDFYGGIFSLPPLAAKIYAYLIFDFEKKGFSFDELVKVFSASKSSVSTSINFLLNTNLIKPLNKIDERKRYFLVNEEFISIRFQEIVERMKREIKILEQLNTYRESYHQNQELSDRYIIYKSLLERNIENIEDTLKKL